MKLQIEFDMDSATVGDDPATEAARIIRRIAELIVNGEEAGQCMDVNNNAVGEWEIT
jgi:hypothetical protein